MKFFENNIQTTDFRLFQTRHVRFTLPDIDGDVILDVEKLQNDGDAGAASNAGVGKVNKSKRLAGDPRFRTRSTHHQQHFSHNRRDIRYTRQVETSTRSSSDPEGTTRVTTSGQVKTNRRRGSNYVEHM